MNNNILLNSLHMRFESQLLKDAPIPFIFHRNILRRPTAFNIHENLELLFFLDGKGRILYDGTHIPVCKGNIIAVNSFVAHQVIPDPVLDQFCLIIDNSFCRYHNIDPAQLLFQPTIHDPLANERFLQIMDACNHQDPFQNTAIKASVLDLLLYLCRHYSTPNAGSCSPKDPALDYVHRAIGYMKTNLARKVTADEVAASAGLSKFHFLREFKRITGQTMTHYLNTIRCEYAKNLLESGQYNVKEVAYLCGFTNNSYFSSVFLKYTGLLPSQVQPL